MSDLSSANLSIILTEYFPRCVGVLNRGGVRSLFLPDCLASRAVRGILHLDTR
ncbi:hypothetical protein H6F74_09775 [Trichocoleus sp. FACHB-90]|nr:hypothetical protein [Trichocoleus sp. FACHB-90]MBD1926529.1 hypothetical protein [Trichocoleus sp. FACHB-90]